MEISLGKYSKAIVALLAALGVLGASLADGTVTAEEGVALFSAFAGVVAVFQVTNKK